MLCRSALILGGWLLAGTTGLLAQATNPVISIDPVQPRVGQPVSVTVTFTAPHPCFAVDDETPVRSGTTIELRTGSCPIGTPIPTPTGFTETWDLGPLPAGTYTVRFRFEGSVQAQTTFQVLACSPGTLCFQGGRFEVEAEWASDISSFGAGTPVQLTADTGYFWFFQPENVELLAKVIDGCALNGHFWFFAAGLTNVETRITVTDTLLGTSHVFTSSRGTPFAPVQSTSLFGCE